MDAALGENTGDLKFEKNNDFDELQELNLKIK